MSTGTTAAQKSQGTMRSPAKTIKVHPSNDPDGIFESAWVIKCHVLAVVKPGGARARPTCQNVSAAAGCSSRSWRRLPGSTGLEPFPLRLLESSKASMRIQACVVFELTRVESMR